MRGLVLATVTLSLALTTAACSGSGSEAGSSRSPKSTNAPSTSATEKLTGFAADSAAVHGAVAELVNDDVAPGVVVLIRHHDKVRVLADGQASTSTQEPMSASHVFKIGSISKSMLSVAVVKLAERGLLSLDDTVEKWLPGEVPEGDDITIAQLLDHSSGIANYTDASIFESSTSLPDEPMTPRELVRLGTSQGMLFKPGTNAHYSNTGYVLLGLIIERVTHHPLASGLQAEVFTPAHMTSSRSGAPAPGTNLAHGYDDGDDVTDVPLAWAWGAGDVVADARDVAKFFQRLLDGHLVQPDSLARMQDPRQSLPEIPGYGLGLAQVDTVCGTAWGHEGQFGGYTTAAWTNQEQDREVVILSNATVDAPAYAFQTVINTGLCGTGS